MTNFDTASLKKNISSPRTLFGLFMSGVAGLFTLTAIIPLFIILTYIITKGISSLKLGSLFVSLPSNLSNFVFSLPSKLSSVPFSFDFYYVIRLYNAVSSTFCNAFSGTFFCELPPPPLVEGGGFGNAILGTIIMVGIGALISVPIGIMAAIYLSEFSNDETIKKRTLGEDIGDLIALLFGQVIGFAIGSVLSASVQPLWGSLIGNIVSIACILGFSFLFIRIKNIVRGKETFGKDVETSIEFQFGQALGFAIGSVLSAFVQPSWGSLIGNIVSITCILGFSFLFVRIKNIAQWIRFATNVLSGVPSIIIGVFAYSAIVLTSKQYSAWAGGFALAILMLPIIIRTTDEALKLVPQEVRQASIGVGANNYQTVLQVVLPAAIPAIITGVTLAVARSAGETAPLLFTALFTQYWPRWGDDALVRPTASLAVLVYNFAIVPFKNQQELAWAAAFILVLLVLTTSVISRIATSRKTY